MVPPETDYGEEVMLSYGKSFGAFMIGFFVTVGGLLGLWFAAGVFSKRNDLNVVLWLLIGALCSLASLAVLAMGVFSLYQAVLLTWRRDRLFLGEQHLHCVSRDGKILTRIPYDNIDAIELLEEVRHSDNVVIEKVGITLIDPGREDTILLEESPLAPQGEENVDVLIRDFYRIPPKKLRKRLMNKWRNLP
jgi:hypothetical protein